MKIAKIMLGAIFFWAVVGGILAFRLRSTFFVYMKMGNECVLIMPHKYEIGGNIPYRSVFTTFQTTATKIFPSYCSVTTFFIVE